MVALGPSVLVSEKSIGMVCCVSSSTVAVTHYLKGGGGQWMDCFNNIAIPHSLDTDISNCIVHDT